MSENTIFIGKLSSLDSSSAVYENRFFVRPKGVWFSHIYKSKVVLLWEITLIKRFSGTCMPESLNKINFQSLYITGWQSFLFVFILFMANGQDYLLPLI